MVESKRSRKRSTSADDASASKKAAARGTAEPSSAETERLEALRDQLYSRTRKRTERERTPLSRSPQQHAAAGMVAGEAAAQRMRRIDDVPHSAPSISQRESVQPSRILNSTDGHTSASALHVSPMTSPRRTNGFRAKIIFVSVVFFAVTLILSSVFLFFGQNTISGNNIEIEVDAPFAIGGGENLTLDISVTNRNAVPVESATLIVEYPPGTQSADGKELFRDRIPLDTLASGASLQVPIEARIFGEENDERTINISVEYRVQGSNALFFKEANPVRVKISSSPVVLMVEAIEEVSSGHEFELTLTVMSNAPEPINNVLVQASYPFGFDFSEATPNPVRGQNLWSIATLEPESEETITVTGVMTGGSVEERTFDFSVGVPTERDRFALASVFTKVAHEIRLTDPFIGLDVSINGARDETVSAGPEETVSVSIVFENTLEDTIYDGEIRVALKGSGLNANNVNVSNGFYNSSDNTIVWTEREVRGLRELTPGDHETVRFSIRGANLDARRTPQIDFDVSVEGRRVSESNVPQALTDAVSRTVQFESVAALSSAGLYSAGPFTNTGPLPPVAEQVTTYTITLTAENGSNELSNTEVTTSLPQYVTWLNTVSTGDTISYNTETREVVWRVGDVGAQAETSAAFQVSFLPSVSQVGTVPTIVGQQYLRATDRFTGSVVRAQAPALTTRLTEDPDENAREGVVQPKE